MSAVQMEENKHQECDDEAHTKEINNNNLPSKPKDSTLLDLGWGLESIHLSDPYEKEFVTLGYTLLSFAMALAVVFIRNYPAVLTIAVIHIIFQSSVFLFCVYKYKYPDTTTKRNSLQRYLSMSIDSNDNIDREYPISRFATEYGFTLYKTHKKSIRTKILNKCSCFVKVHQFLNSFDATFGRQDDPVFVRPYYFRFNVVLYGMITSLFVLCNTAYYKQSPLDICTVSYAFDFIYYLYEPNWDKPNFDDHLAGKHITCTNAVYIYDFCTLYWVWWIAFSGFDLYELKKEYYQQTAKIMTKTLNTFSTSNVKSLHDRTETEIYDNIKSKMQIVSNIYIIVFLCCINYMIMFLWRYLTFNVITFSNVFCPVIEALINTNIVMSLFKICTLSKYPLVITTVFGDPIYCSKNSDILAWWQLQHIYKSYLMPIYIQVLNPTVCIGFVFIVILPFWAVMSIIEDKKIGVVYYYPVQFGVTIVLSICILYCMKQFVSTYEKQKTHVGMLQKEVIRLEANKDQFKDIQEIKDAIKLISEHMTQFDKPIYIATIPMTNAVFTILRGALSGVALLIVAEIMDAS